MIERYRRKVMSDIFSLDSKYKAYLDVELATTKAWSMVGVIPKEDVVQMEQHATFTLDCISKMEKETRHDVVAFTRCVSESLGTERKWFHYGLTSTDVVDTALSLIYKQANDILYDDLIAFRDVLKKQAIKYQKTPCIGRTHGVHADITSFGLKWALWFDEANRNINRFLIARKGLEVGKISGAVGNHANVPPSIQDEVCSLLGLESAKISTQTLQRDRHAFYMSTLALIGASLEKIALEIRHLQRTEVREVEEHFYKGQKGSSAMPHKRNPIASENITGVARMLRGYMITSYEDISLWHERDISHSSVERVIFPDAIMLLDYALNRYAKVLENLSVFTKKMEDNIYITKGVIFSQRVMNKLIEKGLSREEAYDYIQPIAMNAWNSNLNFYELILQDENVGEWLSKSDIEQAFSLDYYLKNVFEIYKRVGIYKGDITI
jgi:adenylosuccinate lyase